jgi:hypothetical protein
MAENNNNSSGGNTLLALIVGGLLVVVISVFAFGWWPGANNHTTVSLDAPAITTPATPANR